MLSLPRYFTTQRYKKQQNKWVISCIFSFSIFYQSSVFHPCCWWGGGMGRKGIQLQLNNNKNFKKLKKKKSSVFICSTPVWELTVFHRFLVSQWFGVGGIFCHVSISVLISKLNSLSLCSYYYRHERHISSVVSHSANAHFYLDSAEQGLLPSSMKSWPGYRIL